MPNMEMELKPIDFITVGTVGPKGQRKFHLQAVKEDQIVSLTIEKEQAWALSEAIKEMLDDLDQRHPRKQEALEETNMDLREPIDPLFRVAQMGLGYDEETDLVVLVAQELVIRTDTFSEAEEDDLDNDDPDIDIDDVPDAEATGDKEEPSTVRFWSSREQMRALSERCIAVVQSGRPDPKQNGRLVYYWT